jgi:hypothetical protein
LSLLWQDGDERQILSWIESVSPLSQELVPLFYDELRKLAAARLSNT